MENEQKYPNPLIVGDYVEKNDFEKAQNYSATDSGSWIHFTDQAQMSTQGRYFEVKPLIAEFVTTHLCNFGCPTCSRRMLRETWLGSESTWGKDGQDVIPHTRNTISLREMKIIVDQLANNGVKAVVWGGGEPTLNRDIYEGISFAKERGMYCSLITNGSIFNEPGISKILNHGIDLIRVSLNCATPEKHASFHGYSHKKNYFNQVVNNIRRIAEIKNSTGAITDYGISVILDNKNIDEINALVNLLYEIVNPFNKSPIDFLVLRSVYNYYGSFGHIDEKTYQTYESINIDQAFSKLADCGMKIVIPKSDSLKEKSDCALEKPHWQCLGYGWCTEIHPSGDMFICSDAYGNPEYVIGNLLREEFNNIWFGEKRRLVLENINKNNCLTNYCPFTGRGHHLNRIFNQIEDIKSSDFAKLDEWMLLLEQLTSRKIPFYL